MKMNQYAHAWSQSVQQSKRLNLPRNQRFIFFHNPRNWEVSTMTIGKKQLSLFIPKLNNLILEAGINNVRSVGSQIDYSYALAELQKQGCTVLLPEQHDYMVKYPVHGGFHYCTKFLEVEEVAGTVITTFNKEAFDQFKIELIQKGVIEIPHDHFIRLMLHQNQNKINRLSGQLHNPASKARYEKAIEFEKQVKQARERLKKYGVKAYEQRRQNEKINQSTSTTI
tara:strand:- start:118 stop:792 length:675 start_codon:yes stop_codon:yes gene_type:complete